MTWRNDASLACAIVSAKHNDPMKASPAPVVSSTFGMKLEEIREEVVEDIEEDDSGEDFV